MQEASPLGLPFANPIKTQACTHFQAQCQSHSKMSLNIISCDQEVCRVWLRDGGCASCVLRHDFIVSLTEMFSPLPGKVGALRGEAGTACLSAVLLA